MKTKIKIQTIIMIASGLSMLFNCASGNARQFNKLLEEDFATRDIVEIGQGVGKGKGFQGVVKRYGHRGGPAAHGSRFHRHPGSMGANSTPSRVFKGVKLPGRTGSLKTSIKNLKIVKVYEDKNILLVSGSVPGPEKSIITIEKL